MHNGIRFGGFELLPTERQLLHEGRPVPVGARAFDLLLALIERRDRLVSKNELLDLVWPGLVVEEANLPVQVSSLRKLIGAQAIATIPGRGYRFSAPIRGDAVTEEVGDLGAAAVPARTNVPVARDTLLGRDDDIAELSRWLTQHRLVTVLGPGGIGKTRVAQAVAGAAAGLFPHGVWWVDLAAISSVDKIASGIAKAAQLPLADGDAQALLGSALAGRELLLVLDNCEHLADGVTTVTGAVLAAAAGVRVLATSQERLRLAGEHVYLLSPLSGPPVGVSLLAAKRFAAFQLLEQRAQAVDSRFSITESTLAPAIELCQRLDGIALAIEMAAARAPMLGLKGLTERLGERLDLLRAASRDAPARQQTLRATLDWSHGLLDSEERTVLRRLAVFSGSFGLDAAQHLASMAELGEWAVVDALAGLVDKSLVALEQVEPPRYRLADTVRVYGREQLARQGELDATLLRHGETMSRIALEAVRCDWPESTLMWHYLPDLGDLADAFDRACARQDAEVAAAVVGALRMLDGLRGVLSDARARVEAAYALMPHADDLARARLSSFIVSCGWIAIDYVSRVETARESVRLWRSVGDEMEIYSALSRLATELARAGLLDEAERTLLEASDAEDPGWPSGILAKRQYHAGLVSCMRGDAVMYRAHLQEAVDLFKQAGANRTAMTAHDHLVEAVLMAGDLDGGIALARTGIAALDELDQPAYLGTALVALCKALLLKGDVDGGRDAARRAVALLEQSKIEDFLLDSLALLAALSGESECGSLLLGRADATHAANRSPRNANDLLVMSKAVATLEGALGRKEFARLRAAGAQLSRGRAVAFGRDLLAEEGHADDRVRCQRMSALGVFGESPQ